ncbi:uncharacterized protein G2W53_041032 [Senna tora]|uniref:Uncharacterized protein n=1 Tax=Senna tora TaxID=362788 RepID=A0A834W0Z6_9FABA|nr:uncharacterized protein G2W53_041032 [Senna tora]
MISYILTNSNVCGPRLAAQRLYKASHREAQDVEQLMDYLLH